MNVCIGGTFNILHKGHKYLIDTAFKTAKKDGVVFIGVTKGEMLQHKKFIKPFNERVSTIKYYLKEKGYENQSIIKPIYDIFGIADNEEFNAIIVSPDTINNAKEINKKRESNGKNPLKIIKINYILAEDKKPISSTRIYNKIIDKDGRVL